MELPVTRKAAGYHIVWKRIFRICRKITDGEKNNGKEILDRIFIAGNILLVFPCLVYWFSDVVSADKEYYEYDDQYISCIVSSDRTTGLLYLGDGM